MGKITSGRFRYRYEVAEAVLRRGGSNDEIQKRVMEEFPDSQENPTRAAWYRRRYELNGHCR